MGFKRQVLTDRVLEMMTTAMAPVRVGDAKAPPPLDGQSRPEPPYVIVDALPSGAAIGAAFGDNPEGLGDWIYQVTAIGKTRGQAEFARDKAHGVILDRSAGAFVNPIPLPGSAFVGKRESLGHGPLEPAADSWRAVEQFRLSTSS